MLHRQNRFPVLRDFSAKEGEAHIPEKLSRVELRLLQPHYPVEPLEEVAMNGIIYLIGLIVVIGIILSFLGLR